MTNQQKQTALIRAVNGMMRAMGGTTVKLRVANGTAAGTERELGMTGPAYQEVELGPVVVRNLARKDSVRTIQVLVSASALDQLMPAMGATSGRQFLEKVSAIVVGEDVFQMMSVDTESFGGLEYMFRVNAGRK